MRSMQVGSGYRHAHCAVPRCLVERSRVHQLVGTQGGPSEKCQAKPDAALSAALDRDWFS
jgi:hypothetical protein